MCWAFGRYLHHYCGCADYHLVELSHVTTASCELSLNLTIAPRAKLRRQMPSELLIAGARGAPSGRSNHVLCSPTAAKIDKKKVATRSGY